MTYILSIDPGSNIGWAVYKSQKLYNYGLIDSGKHDNLYERVNYIEDQVSLLFSKWLPTQLVIEGITAISQPSKMANFWLNYTFGFCVSTASRAKIPIVEFNPSVLKKRLKEANLVQREHLPYWGKNGQLNKAGVVACINRHLKLELRQKDHNIADAIGLGLISLGAIT